MILGAQNSGTIGANLSRETITYFTNEGDSIGIELSNSGDTLRAFASGAGGGTDDQVISRSNDTIYLEDGGFVVLPDSTGYDSLDYALDYAFAYTLDSLNTTDGTPDTIFTFTAYQDTNYVVEAFVYGIRTGGTAGNPGDQFNKRLDYKYINVRDTLYDLQADGGTKEDVVGGGLTDAYFITEGTEVKLLVRGVIDYDFTWYSQVLVTKIPYKELATIGSGVFGIGSAGTDDQVLTRSNDTIYLEDGGFVVLPDTTAAGGVPVHADEQIVFGDGATAGGVTENTFVYDDASNILTVLGQIHGYQGKFERGGASGNIKILRTDGAGMAIGGGNAQSVILFDTAYTFEIRGASRANVETAILNSGSEYLGIDGLGSVRLPNYTSSSSFTGTAVGNLAFDASGNIITEATSAGAGDSLGINLTAGFIPFGVDGGKGFSQATSLRTDAAQTFLVTPPIIYHGFTAPAGNVALLMGQGRGGDGNTWVDMKSTTAGDGFRIIRATGANGDASFQNWGTGAINFYTNTSTIRGKIFNTGQWRFNNYTTASSFPGTAVGNLAFDASGNIITEAAVNGDSLGTSFTDRLLIFGDGTRAGQTNANLFLNANNVVLETPRAMQMGNGATDGQASFIEIGGRRSGDGSATIDFVAEGGVDYSTRAIRNAGANGSFSFTQQGTGGVVFRNVSTADIEFETNSLDRVTIDGATGALELWNGTAPTSSPANLISLYATDVSSSSELRVRDEAGNVTTLSPHNFSLINKPSHPMAWAFYSEKELPSGEKVAINVDMYRLAELVEELTGEKLIHIKTINND